MTASPSISPGRRVARAVLLNLIAPGLGYLYAGRPVWAVANGAAIPLLPLALVWAQLHRTFVGAAIFVIGAISLQLAATWHAGRLTRERPARVRGWWKSILTYGVFLCCCLLWLEVTTAGAKTLVEGSCLRVFRINGDSMAPTLWTGDRIVVDTCDSRTPARHRLILFAMPGDRTKAFVKRVVALPGEAVEITAHAVLVNGQAHRQLSEDLSAKHLVGPIVVPQGSVFVLGDKLEASSDSRHFGAVPLSHVRGPALYVLWSSRGAIGKTLTP